MHANSPRVGSEPTEADITATQRRALQHSISQIAARTRDYLPDEFVVGSDISRGMQGVEVTVAVRPPVGNPVSAGFTPEFDGVDDEPISTEDREEVARGLAASAALQVKHALGEDVPATAR